MGETIFREKSMERVSSPEQLNDYIRVTNPGVWITLAAAIVLLAGFLIWGAAGTLETGVDTVAVSDSGGAVCYVREADISRIAEGSTVRIDGGEYTVASVSREPAAVDADFSDYVLHVGGLEAGEWVYAVTLSGALPEGVYEAYVVTDSVSPITFLLN